MIQLFQSMTLLKVVASQFLNHFLSKWLNLIIIYKYCTCLIKSVIAIYMQRKKESREKPKIPSTRVIERKSNKELAEGGFPSYSPSEQNLQKASNQELYNHLRELKKQLSEKQLEVLNADKLYRMESFKNQSYKNRVADTEKYCQKLRIGLTRGLIKQYEGNKDSPLFYNENGLSPYQLMLLNYSKNEDFSENICMICFMDIQPNTHIVRLPCSHILHKECGMQHLLYSKNCPACSEEINISSLKKN